VCWALVLVLVVLRAPGVVIVVKGTLFVFCRMFRKGSSSLDALQQVGSRRRRTGPDHVSAYRELWTTRPLSFRKSVSPSLAPLPVACVAKHGQAALLGTAQQFLMHPCFLLLGCCVYVGRITSTTSYPMG
jgi:hypothetical protein